MRPSESKYQTLALIESNTDRYFFLQLYALRARFRERGNLPAQFSYLFEERLFRHSFLFHQDPLNS